MINFFNYKKENKVSSITPTFSTLGKISPNKISEEKQETSNEHFFTCIPIEILVEIFKYLSPSQYLKLQTTCRLFKSLDEPYFQWFVNVFKIKTDSYDENKSKVQTIYKNIIGISKATTKSENEKPPIEKASVPILFKLYQEKLVSEASDTYQGVAELKTQGSPDFRERIGQIHKKIRESKLFPFSTVEAAHQWLEKANDSEKVAVLKIALDSLDHKPSRTTLAMFIIESDSNLLHSLMREKTSCFIWINLVHGDQTEFAKYLIEKWDQNELYPGNFERIQVSPLSHLISQDKYPDLAKLIIEKSTPEQLQIKYNPTCKNGITTLYMATEFKKQTENVKLMIEKGGLELLKLNNATGLTVLHYAIMYLHYRPYLNEIIELMIEKADLDLLNAKDPDGKTALQLATEYDYPQIATQIQKKLKELQKSEEIEVSSS